MTLTGPPGSEEQFETDRAIQYKYQLFRFPPVVTLDQ